ncbi:MAG: hypothetical protein MUE54_10135 [Anaerolineae bacterium]|jgi:hypothetical protein|nr:hypothetical protein [Anaerolineae bacterium]
MFYQERREGVYLISNIFVSVVYLGFVLQQYQALGLSSENDLRFWGTSILIFIPVQIVTRILIHIIFSIMNTVVTKEEEPTIIDEFDKLIELKSARNFYHTFMFGFVLAMGALALNQSSSVMALILMITIIIAGFVGDISQLYYYRKGV